MGQRSADQDSIPFLDRIRAGSRDSYMNNPVATGALRRTRTNVVGWGLQLQSRIDREFLKMSGDEADRWETKVEREFRLWANSDHCDITRVQNFYSLQQLLCLSVLMNGDVFVIPRYIKDRGFPYRLKLQLLEADMVASPYGLETNKIAGGIELDEKTGRPLYYHIRKSRFLDPYSVGTWTKIRAFGERSGRKNIYHIIDRERIGQRRGLPILAPVLDQLKQITRLSEAELMGAIINAFFTVFLRTETGNAGLQAGYIPEESVIEEDPDGTVGRGATHPDNNQYEMGAGNIIELADGQDITIADSKRPNQNFDPFFQAIVKQIGSSIEMPYEVLMLHFTSSYSASRAAIIEAWKTFRRQRAWIVDQFCQPIYEVWLEEAIKIGRIEAPGFFSDPILRQAWCGSSWAGMGQGQLDPLKETKASAMKIEKNLSTHEDEFQSLHGGDWDGAMRRKSRELRVLNQLDIPVSQSTEAADSPQSAAEDIEDNNSD